ncbi:MAG: hypothetical protein SPG97_02385 [Bacilli bacterium]|nr:hypothetical protein [Bacilli bacterium]
MTEHRSPIPARVYNAAVGGHVCGPEDVDFGQKVVHLIKYDRAGNEVSFESQVTQANKIYVIHDDFTLSSNVTIPANCTLQFEGGSISGAYTLTGNNTGIKAGLIKIFNTNITLAGTWNVAEAYPEWFGAKGDGVADDTNAINCCTSSNSTILSICFIIGKIYKTTEPIIIKNNSIIECINNGRERQSSNVAYIRNYSNNNIIEFESDNVNSVVIRNLNIRKNDSFGYTGNGIDAEKINSILGCSFENLDIEACNIGFNVSFKAYGGYMYNQLNNVRLCWNNYGLVINGQDEFIGTPSYINENEFNRCQFDDNKIGGVKIYNTNTIEQNQFSSCTFQRNGGSISVKQDAYGVYLVTSTTGTALFNNCYFEGNHVSVYDEGDETSSFINADIVVRICHIVCVGCTFNITRLPIAVLGEETFDITMISCTSRDTLNYKYDIVFRDFIASSNILNSYICYINTPYKALGTYNCTGSFSLDFIPRRNISKNNNFDNTTGTHEVVGEVKFITLSNGLNMPLSMTTEELQAAISTYNKWYIPVGICIFNNDTGKPYWYKRAGSSFSWVDATGTSL